MNKVNYIDPATVDKIKEAGNLAEVIESFIQLELKGRSERIGQCLACNDPKGLHVPTSKSKQLFKCVKCDDSGKFPLQYLTQQAKLPYKEALIWIADKYGIDIPEQSQKKTTRKRKTTSKKAKAKAGIKCFRDQQLADSGLKLEDMKFSIYHNDKEYPDNYRYSKGKINQFGEIDSTGDDMILHYLDLNGVPVQYLDKKGKKKTLYRIRFQTPELHDGIRYKSPYKSGSHLWIPNFVLKKYKSKGSRFNTLFVIEGEKKADKLCQYGLCCVGIMGIHNLAFDRMPEEFEALIKDFEVKNVVFLLDEDFQDLSLKSGKPVDQRPRSFFKAVLKFKDYFYSFIRAGMDLKIYFGSHKSNNQHKGLDDLLVANHSEDQDKKIVESLTKAVKNIKHETDHFKLNDITSVNDYGIGEFWELNNVPKFLEQHKDQLKELVDFKIGKFQWRYDEDQDKFELNQKLLEHEKFWIERKRKNKEDQLEFDYIQIEDFLKNRGIGNYQTNDDIWLIQIEGSMVTKVDPREIQAYVIEFTKTLEIPNWKDIARFIKRGVTQYLGHVQTSLLPFLSPTFREPQKESQDLVFSNQIVKIDQADIRTSPDSTYYFWNNQVIDFEFEKLDPLFELTRSEDGSKWQYKTTELGAKSEILQFLFNTSCVYWRKCFDVSHDENGDKIFTQKTSPMDQWNVTEDEIQETFEHLAAKLLSVGYLLHDYVDRANTKAIICLDLKESARGASEGGTGKSLFSIMFQHLVPLFEVDAAIADLSSDKFMFEGVDERTRIILLDDLRSDFDFKTLFSKITNGVKVQRKGLTRIDAGHKKFILNLNGILRGNTNSYIRRQYNIGFTDYYNGDRSPDQEFGHNLFDEWNSEQWNYFYNLAVQCIQLYMTYGLKFTIPKEKLQVRRFRHELGETFIDWADLRFSEDGKWINNEVNKLLLVDDFNRLYQNQRKYMNAKVMKEKLEMYASYSGLDYNIRMNGERIKSGGKEYICLSNEAYSQNRSTKINSDNENFDTFKTHLDNENS